MHKCPGCQADLPGMTTEATLTERVGAKETARKALEVANGLLTTELRTSKETATNATTYLARAEAAETSLAEHVGMGARHDALRAIGVNPADEKGAKVDTAFQTLHAAYKAGVAEGETALTQSEWIAAEEGARTHVLLESYFAGAPAGATAAEIAAAAAAAAARPAGQHAANIPVDNGTGGAPVVTGQKMSSQQLEAHIANMTGEQLRAFQTEHGATYGITAGMAPKVVAPAAPAT